MLLGCLNITDSQKYPLSNKLEILGTIPQGHTRTQGQKDARTLGH